MLKRSASRPAGVAVRPAHSHRVVPSIRINESLAVRLMSPYESESDGPTGHAPTTYEDEPDALRLNGAGAYGAGSCIEIKSCEIPESYRQRRLPYLDGKPVRARKPMNRRFGTLVAGRCAPARAHSSGWGLRLEAKSRRSG